MTPRTKKRTGFLQNWQVTKAETVWSIPTWLIEPRWDRSIL